MTNGQDSNGNGTNGENNNNGKGMHGKQNKRLKEEEKQIGANETIS